MIWPWSKIKRLERELESQRGSSHAISWHVRAAFERGWRHTPEPDENWREAWKQTPERATLVRLGYIKEEDGYR